MYLAQDRPVATEGNSWEAGYIRATGLVKMGKWDVNYWLTETKFYKINPFTFINTFLFVFCIFVLILILEYFKNVIVSISWMWSRKQSHNKESLNTRPAAWQACVLANIELLQLSRHYDVDNFTHHLLCCFLISCYQYRKYNVIYVICNSFV